MEAMKFEFLLKETDFFIATQLEKVYLDRHPIILCPLPHHPNNVLHLKKQVVIKLFVVLLYSKSSF